MVPRKRSIRCFGIVCGLNEVQCFFFGLVVEGASAQFWLSAGGPYIMTYEHHERADHLLFTYGAIFFKRSGPLMHGWYAMNLRVHDGALEADDIPLTCHLRGLWNAYRTVKIYLRTGACSFGINRTQFLVSIFDFIDIECCF